LRFFFFTLSGIFLLAGLGLAAWDFLVPVDPEAFRFRLLGEIWYKAHAGSLNLIQAVVERYLSPKLWDPGIIWFLLQPAALLATGLAILSLIPALLLRRRRKRKLFR
jgi:hypothetical protein